MWSIVILLYDWFWFLTTCLILDILDAFLELDHLDAFLGLGHLDAF